MADVIGLQLAVCQVPYLDLGGWGVISKKPGSESTGVRRAQDKPKGMAPSLKALLDMMAIFTSSNNKKG